MQCGLLCNRFHQLNVHLLTLLTRDLLGLPKIINADMQSSRLEFALLAHQGELVCMLAPLSLLLGYQPTHEPRDQDLKDLISRGISVARERTGKQT